jgi:hypothetical protein
LERAFSKVERKAAGREGRRKKGNTGWNPKVEDRVLIKGQNQSDAAKGVIDKVGKNGTPTRCNNNSFIDLQDQLNMFRASFCPSSGAQD